MSATPTIEERAATANVLRNIANLLRKGLYFGENAGYVQEALSWIERMAGSMSGEAVVQEVPPLPPEPKRKGKSSGA